MTAGDAPRRLRLATLVAGALLGAFLVLLFVPLPAWTRHAAYNLGMLLAATGACAAAALAARGTRGRNRVAWALVAAGAGAWAVGQALWTHYELVRGVAVPFPSLADAGYLGYLVLTVVGLQSFAAPKPEASARARTVLDGLLVGGAFVLLSWLLVLGDAARAAQGTFLETSILLAYPLGDVAIATVALLAASRHVGASREALLVLCASALVHASADTVYALQISGSAYTTGGLLDVGWMLAFALAAVAAVHATASRGAPRESSGTPSLAAASLVYVPVAAALAAVAWTHVARGPVDAFVGAGLLAILSLVLARQFLFLRENVALARRLEAAYATLRAAEAERKDLLNGVAHDLMNPILPIQLELARMKRVPREETDARAIRVIERSAGQIQRLVHDVRLLASVESGRFSLKEAEVDLAKLARGAAEAFEGLAEHRNVTLEVDADGPLLVHADAARLDQVIGNLLTNAIKFTPANGRVRVTTRLDGAHARLSVSDTGIGLAPESIARLFQPFTQVHDEGAVAEGGTGLGLYVSRTIVERHGGRIWCDSRGRGHGATFHFTLASDSPSRSAVARGSEPPGRVAGDAA